MHIFFDEKMVLYIYYDGIYRQKLSTDYCAHVAMNIYLYLMNIYSYLRYMNLSGERWTGNFCTIVSYAHCIQPEHLISAFNFAILHSLDTHFVYLLAIKSMPIMINPTPNPAQPNHNHNPNPKPTTVSHSLLICFNTAVLHTPTSNPSSPCPFFLKI